MIFLDQNKSCGRIRLYVRGRPVQLRFDVRQPGHRGFRTTRPRRVFEEFLRHVWFLERFRETRHRRFSHPRGLLGTSPSSSSSSRLQSPPQSFSQRGRRYDRRGKRRPAIRNEKFTSVSKLRGVLFRIRRTRDD